MNCTKTFRLGNSNSAFTLIELLTVVVIIGVLVALLLPAISGARARADGVQCASNLRQIGAAIGMYAADNDNALPGPLAAGQMPTYTTADSNSLPVILAKYLNLPAASAAAQKAPIFICPAYARLFPALDSPVYAVEKVGTTSPFGDPAAASQPMRIAALPSLSDGSGNPAQLSRSVAVRDYVKGGGTLVTQWVTWDSQHPVHGDYLNALFLDWHVAKVDPFTLQPK